MVEHQSAKWAKSDSYERRCWAHAGWPRARGGLGGQAVGLGGQSHTSCDGQPRLVWGHRLRLRGRRLRARNPHRDESGHPHLSIASIFTVCAHDVRTLARFWAPVGTQYAITALLAYWPGRARVRHRQRSRTGETPRPAPVGSTRRDGRHSTGEPASETGLPVATGALDEASYRILAKHKVEIACGTREIG